MKKPTHRSQPLLRSPSLRFTPTAWAKLQYFCHRGSTEIGGFGVTDQDDLLLVQEFITVKQETTEVSVAFDDAAVADHFETQVDLGRTPEQFARIWLHTHPGDCPNPSTVDEKTFERVFGKCDWAVMFILARNGATYARMHFNAGPGGDLLLPVAVAYDTPFAASNEVAWEAEFKANIHRVKFTTRRGQFWDDMIPELDPGYEIEFPLEEVFHE